MPGLGELALGAAPIAGGALFGIAAGTLKPPDVRAAINKDLDLLDRLPAEQVQRRERLQESINQRIDDLLTAAERSRNLRRAATSYEGNWRDIVVFICAVLFTIVWWNVSHERANWLLMFLVMIAVSALAGYYAARGIVRALRHLNRDRQSS
ncbi:V-type ATPase subunit a family protein [Mycolicibacterium smegmatis]|jgi:ABC-type antimicrobial peptide transport system permease subunit|uniref:Uncharacterized protein n=1 Tax=Mycolicibacterium elephantis TaxID=81858 RepID=A0A1X0CZS6_9MYCO|nr:MULTISPECIES: hypothetical protein [Mycolicibacterium]MCP2625867.1 V-type ATPase subunit a family protein [Mycolicibacterium smegmatis]ORA65010.1 hypothetical protein BST23_15815 [Mycolicibacterium elephantis]